VRIGDHHLAQLVAQAGERVGLGGGQRPHLDL